MTINPMDPANPITALCIQGMEAETRGDASAAQRLFQQAWDQHITTIEAAVAAHYLARHQGTADDTLLWNQRALDAALASDPDSVAVLMPSLHLTVGQCQESSGQTELARHHYEQAAVASHVLGDDGYGQMLREGITAALMRTNTFADHVP